MNIFIKIREESSYGLKDHLIQAITKVKSSISSLIESTGIFLLISFQIFNLF